MRALQKLSTNMYLLNILFSILLLSAWPITQAASLRDWRTSIEMAKDLALNLTLEQQVGVLTGQGLFVSRCTGNTFGSSKAHLPSLCFNDGPSGVRGTDLVSAFPAPLTVAASWDRNLLFLRGKALGRQARTKGINVLLAPVVNLVRSPQAGRVWETFGPDPFLSSIAGVQTINGIQEHNVIACVKHLFGRARDESPRIQFDDRTLHEAYLAPFTRAYSDANTACVMCGYNKVNGTYACENPKLISQTGVIRAENPFGFVLSDWGSTHSTIASAEAGLDVDMPGDFVLIGSGIYGENLVRAVLDMRISHAAVFDKVVAVLSTYFRFKQDQNFPRTNFDSQIGGSIPVNTSDSDSPTNEHVNTRLPYDKQLIRDIAAASTVLLKNSDNLLPIKAQRYRKVAVIGKDALQGNVSCFDNACNEGVVALGWGAGSANLTFLEWPVQSLRQHVRKNAGCRHLELVESAFDCPNAATLAASCADLALVFVNADSGEQILLGADNNTAVALGNVQGVPDDRPNLTLWNNAELLIKAVADRNKNTVVIIHAPGAVIMERWIDHPNVKAVLYAGMPGEQAGPAIVDVLFGNINPSAKLPFTIAKKSSDYPYQIDIRSTQTDIHYKEGLLLDYRWFDAYSIEPRFAFGFGLSYTRFAYSRLHFDFHDPSHKDRAIVHLDQANSTGLSNRNCCCRCNLYSSNDPLLTIRFTVKNTGTVKGKEVSQLYLSYKAPIKNTSGQPEPPRLLKGFEITSLMPNESRQVTIHLEFRDLMYWNTEEQAWRFICRASQNRVRPGCKLGVMIGASSRDIKLEQIINLDHFTQGCSE